MSAGFISWIIAMLIAITALGCANSTDRLETFLKESLAKFQNAFAVVKWLCMEWPEDGLVFVLRYLLSYISFRCRRRK